MTSQSLGDRLALRSATPADLAAISRIINYPPEPPMAASLGPDRASRLGDLLVRKGITISLRQTTVAVLDDVVVGVMDAGSQYPTTTTLRQVVGLLPRALAIIGPTHLRRALYGTYLRPFVQFDRVPGAYPVAELYVDEGCRNRGIGGRLLEHAEDLARRGEQLFPRRLRAPGRYFQKDCYDERSLNPNVSPILPAMEREIRYCTTEDTVLIAYSVTGDGPPLLVCHEGLESFTLDHLVSGQEDFFDQLGRGHCLIRYDPRGIGLSQRDIEDFSLEVATRDILAVVEATGFERMSIFAPCFGTRDAIAFAARYPERVQCLVLYSASARSERDGPTVFDALAQLWRTNPRVAAQSWVDLVDRRVYPELCAQLATLIAQSINRNDAAARIEQWGRSDVTDLLPLVQAPTLVLHRRGDRGNPIASAQGIAARIPAAKLVMLEGDAHWFAMAPDALLASIRAFLPGDPAATPDALPAAAALRTILFTDIVGHTNMMQRLGDDRGRDVLREHERITRDLLKQYSGAEVKTMGDGFMASFDSVTKAVDCAIALQRAFAAHTASMPEPLHVRVGLNAGEPIEEGGDLFGSTVILASRIAAKAGAGEILVPDTVRGLLSGKSFLFSDRGAFVPKGFDDAVRLYEVQWQPEVAADTNRDPSLGKG